MNPQSLVSPSAQNTALPFAFTGPSAMLFANFLALNNDPAGDVSAPGMPQVGNSSSAPVDASPAKKNLPPAIPGGKTKAAPEKSDHDPSLPATFAIPVPVELANWPPIQLPGLGSAAASERKDGVIGAANFQHSSSSAQGIFDPLRTAQPTELPEHVEASSASAKTSLWPITGNPVSTEFDDLPIASVPENSAPTNEEGIVISAGDQEKSNQTEMNTGCTADETLPTIADDGQRQVAACTPETAITPAVGDDLLTSNQPNATSAGDATVTEPSLPAGTPQTGATIPNSTTFPTSPSGVAIPYSSNQLTSPAKSAISNASTAKSPHPLSLPSASKPLITDAIGSRSAPQVQIARFESHPSLAKNSASESLAPEHSAHHATQTQEFCAPNQDKNKASCDLVANPEPKNSGEHASSHDGRVQSEESNAAPNAAGAKSDTSKPAQTAGASVSSADTDAQSSSAQTNTGVPLATLVQPALTSNASHDPAAAQTSVPAVIAPPQLTHSSGTNADVLPSSVAKPVEDAHPSATGSVQGVRFVQNPAQAEMRLGLRTESFGAVQVHTSISDKSVDVTLGSEHGDLKNFIVSELPALQSTLQQHDLRLNQLRTVLPSYSSQPDVFAGNGGQSRHSQQQGERHALLQFQEPLPETDEVTPRVNGGLSIRA